MNKEMIVNWIYVHPLETVIIGATLVFIACMLAVLRK